MKSYIETGLSDCGNDEWVPDYVETEKLIARDHGFLFDFIDYDFSEAEHMLNRYLSGFNDGSGTDEDMLKKAFDEIRKSHPYFRNNPSNVAWFLNRIIVGYIAGKYPHKEIAWQKKTFSLICVSRYSPYMDFDTMYSQRLESGGRHILSWFLDLQKRLKRWLFMVLDDTNPDLKQYSLERRSMMYGYFYGANDTLIIKTEIRPTLSKRMKRASLQYEMDRINENGDLEQEEQDNQQKKKRKKTSSELLEEAYDSIDLLMDFTPEGSLPKTVKKMLDGIGESEEETAKKKEFGMEGERRESEEIGMVVHEVDGLSDLLDFEIYGMMNSGKSIRRCRNCGRYFMPKGRNDELCNRPIPGTDRTCYDKGLMPVFEQTKELKAYLSNEYNKASNKHDAKVRRGTETKEFLAVWRKEAKRRKKLAEEGKIDAKEFIEWLKNC